MTFCCINYNGSFLHFPIDLYVNNAVCINARLCFKSNFKVRLILCEYSSSNCIIIMKEINSLYKCQNIESQIHYKGSPSTITSIAHEELVYFHALVSLLYLQLISIFCRFLYTCIIISHC